MSYRAIPLPYIQGTKAWEEKRRDSIGSSTIPIITGSSPYANASPFDLWAWMTRRIEALPIDPATQELYDLGHALEPVIADRYTAKYGRKVRRVRRMLRHPEIEWATASLDRVSAVRGERLIVECKWDPWARFGQADEEVPGHVQDQVQWQLMVTGFEAAEVAVLMGNHVSRLEVTPDPDYQADLLFVARRFYEDHVVAGVPPTIDGSEATRKAIGRLHATADGPQMEPTAELEALMGELREARPKLAAADEEVGRIKNAIRFALGDHSGAETDRWRVSFKKGKPARRTAWKAVAVRYSATLDRAFGRGYADATKAVADNTTTGEGTRPLVPKFHDVREEGEGHWT